MTVGSNPTNERRDHLTTCQSNTEPPEPSEPSELWVHVETLPVAWETWAAAERTDHLHSRLLIADNHRMKNGRKSSRRRQWCWLNVRSAESTLKRQVLNHSPCFHVSADVWLNTRPDVRRLHPRWHLPVAPEAETELRKLLEMIRDSS